MISSDTRCRRGCYRTVGSPRRGRARAGALSVLAVLAIAGCGSQAAHRRSGAQNAQQQAANDLGGAAATSTSTAGGLPDYHATVQAMVTTKVRGRLAKIAAGTPGAPKDARILFGGATCTQDGGTENYRCPTDYTVMGASEGYAHQFEVDIAVTCFGPHSCTIEDVKGPTDLGGS